MKSYDICLSLTDLSRLAYYPPVPSTLLQIRPPSLLTLVVNLEIAKTTLGFDHLLGGLTELTKSCYTQKYDLLQLKDTD